MTNRTHIPLPNLGLGGFVENEMGSDPRKPVATFSKKCAFFKNVRQTIKNFVIWCRKGRFYL